MANRFDGDKIYKNVINSVDKDHRNFYLKLNISLPADESKIDDVSRFDELSRCV